MKKYLFDYDDSNLESIMDYSKEILNKQFSEIIETYNNSSYKTYSDFHNKIKTDVNPVIISSNSKGKYGNYIEQYFYGYKPNSNSESDFSKVGVELKVTPFKINKNKSISSKERLVLSILNYMEENLDNFYKTHLWEKCSKILLLFYNGLNPNKDINTNVIEKLFLYEWFEDDLPTILEDYERITSKINAGKAHELSESDGYYLSTCTKGKGKGQDLRPQPFSDTLAKQRAWCLKNSYMTYLINNRIFNKKEQESITSLNKNNSKPFTKIIEEKILSYKGLAADELYEKFNVKTRSKDKNSILIRTMLGLTGNIDNTAEFKKANINLRVIRVNKNGLPKEDSPFKTYEFKELASNSNWEESHVYNEIYNKKFLFVIFKEGEDKKFYLDNIKFWGFSEQLLDELQRVWSETRSIITKGVELTIKNNKVSTNFPQSKINKILFTKIHAQNSYYEIKKDVFIGKGNLSDTDLLPDGRNITKHSFWIPKKFLKEILDGNWD